ncbi:cation:proton antiporter [Microbacterium album]|uniref:Na+/H+ antiporter subunit G n=1 Tax=Microbacterium album TaxID=2053191 RepID=A0A917MM92_9MICO|nr:monovalent cation/H(+) antiporter subunit G [Microbacterium album]GGH45700.1 hypothetical protein GCM10010921_21270 [Microbacterium album]
MAVVLEVAGLVLVVAGTAFFTAGTLGLMRFPDVRTRLHALTKADNLGLGLLLGGVALLLGEWRTAALLLIAWLCALMAASVSAHVLGSLNASADPRERERAASPRDGA